MDIMSLTHNSSLSILRRLFLKDSFLILKHLLHNLKKIIIGKYLMYTRCSKISDVIPRRVFIKICMSLMKFDEFWRDCFRKKLLNNNKANYHIIYKEFSYDLTDIHEISCLDLDFLWSTLLYYVCLIIFYLLSRYNCWVFF